MSTIEITRLNPKDINDNMIEIFTDGFENYPLMEYFFGDTYKQSIKCLIKIICDKASKEESLLVGGFIEGKLQGVASITPPQIPKNDNKIDNSKTVLEEEFAEVAGEEALMRMEAYSNLKKANKPSSSHFYIDVLGVNPQSQGKGIGSAILSYIHQISEQDSNSCGVALDTQTENNVGYYQRFGYRVSNTAELENVKNWFMFRPNSV